MRKLEPVEAAKTLFEEAKDWGMWQWLTGKSKLRRTADAAWEALDEYEAGVKASWSEDLQKAWREAETRAAASADGRAMRSYEKAKEAAKGVSADIKLAAQRLQQADAEAYKMRMAAEAHFDEADRRMSTSMACEGSQMAIDAWLQREKFVRKIEAAGREK